jgi:hypothetical protein
MVVADITPESVVETSYFSKLRTLTNVFVTKEHHEEDTKEKQHIRIEQMSPYQVWKEMDHKAVYHSILDGATDPRSKVQEECVMIGVANATMAPMDLISHCVPGTNCERRICFNVDELYMYVQSFEGKPGKIPNKWADEIKLKVPELADAIEPFIEEDWILSIKLHHKVVEVRNKEIKEGVDVTMFNSCVTALMDYFKDYPALMAVGTFLKKVGTFIPPWAKTVLSTPLKGMYWILNNPFMVNFCILMSKATRMIVCCKLSGVTSEDMKKIMAGLWTQVTDNPIAAFFVRAAGALYDCVMSLNIRVFIGDFSSFLTCAAEILKQVAIGFAEVQKNIMKFLVTAIMYLLRRGLEFILPQKWVDKIMGIIDMAIDGASNPLDGFKALVFGDADSTIKLRMMGIVRDEFFENFSTTAFFGLLSILPSSTLDWFLAVVLPLLPAGGYVEKAKDLLMKCANQLNGAITGTTKKYTIGDVIVLALKAGEGFKVVYKIFWELHGWFVDVGGCYLMKKKAWLKKALHLSKSTDEIESACCFKDFVNKLKTALIPPVPNAAQKMALATKNGVVAAYNGVLGYFSGGGQHVLMSRPILSGRFQGKLVHFWLCRDGNRVHIAVKDEELQHLFPNAVSKGPLKVLRYSKLPAQLRQVLALLNR